MPDEVSICGINTYHISIMSKNRSDEKEYLKRRENQYHPDTKVPTLTCTNFEEFNLAFTAAVRRQNDIIVIPLH